MFNFIEKFKKINIPFFSSFQIYIDLGTTNTRIAVKDKGVVLTEPTCLGYNKKLKEYIFFGQEAKSIIGKVPDFIAIDRPIINGIISNFDSEAALISNFIKRSVNPYLSKSSLIKPPISAITAVPFIATEIEQKAVEEVLYKVGVAKVDLIEKPVATAIGCGFNIFAHKPTCIVDLGGGLVEISIISGGGIVVQKTLKTAGEHMNKLIYSYIYLKHGLILGENTCEDLKIKLLNFQNEEKTLVVRGKSLETGLPKSVKIKSSDVKEALLPNFNQIIDAIKEIVELSPPEVVDEIYNQGIILAGSLANSPAIDDFFANELKIKVKLEESPDLSTITGLVKLGRRRDTMDKLKVAI